MWTSYIHSRQSSASGYQTNLARSSAGMRSSAARVFAQLKIHSHSTVNGRKRSITSPSLSSVAAALRSARAAGLKSEAAGPTESASKTEAMPRSARAIACAPWVWYSFFVRCTGSIRARIAFITRLPLSPPSCHFLRL
jgi:hypothetical protein